MSEILWLWRRWSNLVTNIFHMTWLVRSAGCRDHCFACFFSDHYFHSLRNKRKTKETLESQSVRNVSWRPWLVQVGDQLFPHDLFGLRVLDAVTLLLFQPLHFKMPAINGKKKRREEMTENSFVFFRVISVMSFLDLCILRILKCLRICCPREK